MVHLTNYTLNKNGENFVSNEEADEDGVGSKWSLSALKRKFKLLEIDYDALMVRIKDVIVKTVISVQPHVLARMKELECPSDSFFEVYGFDVMMDSDLKPWILEVEKEGNTSKNLSRDKFATK